MSARPTKRTVHVAKRAAAGKVFRSPGTVSPKELYFQLVDNLVDYAVFVVARDRRIMSWSLGAQRVYGYSGEEITGHEMMKLVPEELQSQEESILRRIFAGKLMDPFQTRRVCKDGSLVEVWVTMSPVRNSRGRIIGAFKIVRDVTQRRKDAHALHDSEQKLQAILDAAVDAIITIDDRGIIESANPATQRLFGYSEKELVGQNVRLLMPQPYQGEHDGYIRNYVRTGQAKIIGIGREVSGMRKDGTIFPLNLSISEVHLEGRRLFTGMVHDLTERRRLEKQILEVSANEQRRIGQDLHDGLCQELVGCAFSAELLANQLQTKSLPQTKIARQLGASIRQAAGQARSLAHGLNPVDFKGGGLPAALKHLASKVSRSFGIRCTFRDVKGADVKDDAVATHFYRIAQEAVSNAIKHGKATRVTIQLQNEEENCLLIVEDNGVGLSKTMAESISRGSFSTGASAHTGLTGIGLQTMRYRARIIGGTFDIKPKARGGTMVCCSVHRELHTS